MEPTLRSAARSRFLRSIGTGVFYAVVGSVLGAVVLVSLGMALDWATTTLDPPMAFVVVAFVSGVLPLFVAGAVVGWMEPTGLRRRAILSAGVALVVGGLWGLAASASHAESVIVSVAEVGLGNAVAALFCALLLGAVRGWSRPVRRGGAAA